MLKNIMIFDTIKGHANLGLLYKGTTSMIGPWATLWRYVQAQQHLLNDGIDS
jgi:hypothetical protein